jgi:hypothetical protein
VFLPWIPDLLFFVVVGIGRLLQAGPFNHQFPCLVAHTVAQLTNASSGVSISFGLSANDSCRVRASRCYGVSGKRLTAFHELLELVGNPSPELQNPFNPLAVLGTAFDVFPQSGCYMIWNSDQVAYAFDAGVSARSHVIEITSLVTRIACGPDHLQCSACRYHLFGSQQVPEIFHV